MAYGRKASNTLSSIILHEFSNYHFISAVAGEPAALGLTPGVIK